MVPGRRRWLALSVSVLAMLPACGASNEVKAVTATAVTVAAVAANRAITGECWAACTSGYVCDHESGLCVEGECSPACPETQTCVRVDGVLECADKGTAWASNMQGSSQLLPSGGAPRQAYTGVPSAASSAAPASQRNCAVPGSTEWYAEQAAAPAPAGALAREFIGLWSVVGTSPPNGDDGPRPLVVTDAWFGRSADAATHYRTLSEAGALLELEVWSDAAPARQPLSIEFGAQDRFKLHGVDYQREDCARPDAHPACCALPRASWVELGPASESEPQGPAQ